VPQKVRKCDKIKNKIKIRGMQIKRSNYKMDISGQNHLKNCRVKRKDSWQGHRDKVDIRDKTMNWTKRDPHHQSVIITSKIIQV
jgi:hypothetical protein